MNWKFWKQKSVPAAPVVKMTEVEAAIYEDLIRTPGLWQVRRAAVEDSFRADRGGVTITSMRPGPQFIASGPFGVPVKIQVPASAVCGKMVFGPEFSNIWHNAVEAFLTEKEAQNARGEAARVEAELVRLFVK